MKLERLWTFFFRHADDLLIPAGMVFLIFATFLWSTIGGFYLIGVCFIALGVLLGLAQRGRK